MTTETRRAEIAERLEAFVQRVQHNLTDEDYRVLQDARTELLRLSEAQEALRAVIETWRGYQRFSEAEINHKVRSKDKTYRATRIAEAATLNVCISELAEAIKDRVLARLTAAPEAQPLREKGGCDE